MKTIFIIGKAELVTVAVASVILGYKVGVIAGRIKAGVDIYEALFGIGKSNFDAND